MAVSALVKLFRKVAGPTRRTGKQPNAEQMLKKMIKSKRQKEAVAAINKRAIGGDAKKRPVKKKSMAKKVKSTKARSRIKASKTVGKDYMRRK